MNYQQPLQYHKKQGTVTEEHPLLAQHIVLGAMRADYKPAIEEQVSRLLQMPSSNNDPDFWKVILWGNIRYTKQPGYVAVRKLVVGDICELIEPSLCN